jgi:hypothetical protein
MGSSFSGVDGFLGREAANHAALNVASLKPRNALETGVDMDVDNPLTIR